MLYNIDKEVFDKIELFRQVQKEEGFSFIKAIVMIKTIPKFSESLIIYPVLRLKFEKAGHTKYYSCSNEGIIQFYGEDKWN